MVTEHTMTRRQIILTNQPTNYAETRSRTSLMLNFKIEIILRVEFNTTRQIFQFVLQVCYSFSGSFIVFLDFHLVMVGFFNTNSSGFLLKREKRKKRKNERKKERLIFFPIPTFYGLFVASVLKPKMAKNMKSDFQKSRKIKDRQSFLCILKLVWNISEKSASVKTIELANTFCNY